MNTSSTQSPPAFLLEAALLIEERLDQWLGEANLPPHLYEAAHYAVVNGGKRVRPALTLFCTEAVGGSMEQSLRAAIAVECIHCFSLVHDDLPAIDDDELRRGKPTLHIHAGEAMALLAGDLLLPLAFTQLYEGNYKPEQQVQLMKELAQATREMVVGQVYDTLGGFDPALSPNDCLELIHKNKTGSLIRCACVMGGICGNASEKQQNAITEFGEIAGLMFQIVDDLIDYQGATAHVGKTTGKDAEAGKMTYPGTIGVEASKATVLELQKRADTTLQSLGEQGETLRSFNLWMAHRTR